MDFKNQARYQRELALKGFGLYSKTFGKKTLIQNIFILIFKAFKFEKSFANID
jgi:hypothetical protein